MCLPFKISTITNFIGFDQLVTFIYFSLLFLSTYKLIILMFIHILLLEFELYLLISLMNHIGMWSNASKEFARFHKIICKA